MKFRYVKCQQVLRNSYWELITNHLPDVHHALIMISSELFNNANIKSNIDAWTGFPTKPILTNPPLLSLLPECTFDWARCTWIGYSTWASSSSPSTSSWLLLGTMSNHLRQRVKSCWSQWAAQSHTKSPSGLWPRVSLPSEFFQPIFYSLPSLTICLTNDTVHHWIFHLNNHK